MGFRPPLLLSEILSSFLKYPPPISASHRHFLPNSCHHLKLSCSLNFLFACHFLPRLTLSFVRAGTWSVLFTSQPSTWTNAWHTAVTNKRLMKDKRTPCLLPASSPQLTGTMTLCRPLVGQRLPISPTLHPSLGWTLFAMPISVLSGWDQYHPQLQSQDLIGRSQS